MVEAKAKDLAVSCGCGRDIPRFAPDHAARFGLDRTEAVDTGEADDEDEDGGEE